MAGASWYLPWKTVPGTAISANIGVESVGRRASTAPRGLIFQRDGTTLVAECPVSFTTAALGGSITVPGVDGDKIEIKIPAGIQSGETLRHRGAGMSILNGRGRGDLVARILVETPTKLSAKQRELLQNFRETETGEECPATKSFFKRMKGALGG